MPRYDLCFAWYWEYDTETARMLETACATKGVTVYQVRPDNVIETLHKLHAGDLQFGAFFDRANDDLRFAPLRQWMREQGVLYINLPETSFTAEQKDQFHHTLIQNGVPVPPTIILPAFVDAPLLPAPDLSALGSPFVAKPAYGGGGAGVVIGLTNWAQAQQARLELPEQRYLLQATINPEVLESRPAWFRVYYCAEAIYPCWWHPITHLTEPVTTYEEARFGLAQLRALTKAVAALSGIHLFSTEIARNAQGQFFVVDYVNDSIDLRAKSKAVDGVPDSVLWYIATALAAFVARHKE